MSRKIKFSLKKWLTLSHEMSESNLIFSTHWVIIKILNDL